MEKAKTATMKIFEYSSLGKELKVQTEIAQKQYQRLYNTFGFEKKKSKKKNQHLKKYDRLNLIFDSKYSFYPSYNIKSFRTLP